MPTTLAPDTTTSGRLVAESAELLRDRAASLRTQAEHLPEVLATTYRRRAAELELQAWVIEIESGVPYDQIRPAA